MSYRDGNGYRYVRQYTTKRGERRWACWTRVNGRMTRVGQVLSYQNALAFIHSDPYGPVLAPKCATTTQPEN